ncbi:hypothetical protein F5Y12DRAFT_715429 [Xylaria sp. FL1777]|nr:hypothetical protein F5Y12DRAFT_715429 [Xylaria sp. FL1777]
MSTNTSSESLTAVSLLFYRRERSGQVQLLVRTEPQDSTLAYSIPYRSLQPGEKAVDCARRIGASSLGIDIPEDDFDFQMSAVVNNVGESVKIRVFILPATPQIEEIVGMRVWRGWEYRFLRLSSADYLFLHPNVGATIASLRELVRPPPGQR